MKFSLIVTNIIITKHPNNGVIYGSKPTPIPFITDRMSFSLLYIETDKIVINPIIKKLPNNTCIDINSAFLVVFSRRRAPHISADILSERVFLSSHSTALSLGQSVVFVFSLHVSSS